MFWFFIFLPFVIVIVAGPIVGLLRNRETQKTIRLGIEKGQPLEPLVVAKLLAPQRRHGGTVLAGLILLALGLGLLFGSAIWGHGNGGMLERALGSEVGMQSGFTLILVSLAVLGFGVWELRAQRRASKPEL